jgi:hypothetical protein
MVELRKPPRVELRKSLRKEGWQEKEMIMLGLTKDEYDYFLKYFDWTDTKDLPDDFKKFHLEKTGYPVESILVDLGWAREVFAEYVKICPKERNNEYRK